MSGVQHSDSATTGLVTHFGVLSTQMKIALVFLSYVIPLTLELSSVENIPRIFLVLISVRV
jgi:hypothetical protein